MHIGIASPVTIGNIESILELKKTTLPECVRGTNVAIIIEKLLKEGFRVTIYTLSQNVNTKVTYWNKNAKLHIGRYRKKHRAWDLFRKEIETVREMINCDPPEIVHCNWSYEFAMGSLKTKIPTLVTLRDWAPNILKYLPDHYRLARLIINNKVLKKAKNITANSPYVKDLAEKKLKRTVSLIPNPVDDNSFRNTAKKMNSNVYKIISVNNGFSKYKNVKTLMHAFVNIQNEIKNIQLWLVGDGYEKNGIAQNWAMKNGINIDNIFFWGETSSNKLLQLYDQSDLLVHPSLEESFGNTLVEAMARKVPVIAGEKSGAVPWVLDYGKAGLLVNVNDSRAIAESIIHILSDNYTWSSFSEMGYENVFHRFRVSEIIRLYIEEYKKTIAMYNT
jgi:glycosyltransferase involved in cell wall biosynthesis